MSKHSRKPIRKIDSTSNSYKKWSDRDGISTDREVGRANNYTTKIHVFVWYPLWLVDQIFSYIFWLELHLYRCIAGRSPMFLKREADSCLMNKETVLTDMNYHLKTEVAELTAMNNHLTPMNYHLKREVAELTGMNNHLKREIAELTAMNNHLTPLNYHLKREVAELTAMNNHLKREIAELTAMNYHLKEEVAESTAMNNRLLKEVAKFTSKTDRHSDEICKLKNDVAIKEKEISLSKIEIEKLKKKLIAMKCENETFQDKTSMLIDDQCVPEAVNQDALRRPNEAVSVKDNNTNTIDLNDQCRPTKLAEMFSELYDNEWTTAYAVLSVVFTEKQTISILLDIVMDAYEFCEVKVEEVWCILTEWFLDENSPGTKETMQWLKDGRKANINKQFSKLEKDFSHKLKQLCDDDNLRQLLPDVSMNAYLMKCIELCLLMVASDPPIVLMFPGWRAMVQSDDTVLKRIDTNEESEPRYNITQQSNVTEEVEDMSMYQVSGNVKRPHFDKELFQKYTIRGKYLDYIVWPPMYLHRDGPLLSKGIAQGTKIQCRKVRELSRK